MFEDLVRMRKHSMGGKSDVELFCGLDVEVLKTARGDLVLFVREVVTGTGVLLPPGPGWSGLDRVMSELLGTAVPRFLAA